MKKILIRPTVLFMGLISCNSGSSSEKSGKDSTQTTSAGMNTDTTHAATSSSVVEALPAIPAGAKVFFKNLKDGQVVTSPLKIVMGATNISVDSAGTVKPNSGHFHLIIDDGDSTATGIAIPKDSTHLHFGNAQKEATISLKPGKHKIALQFADGFHRSYGSQLSAVVTVDVKK